ncbi:MAG: hypothetical protein ACOYL7_17450 [Caldilinea sp.]
MRLLSLPGLLYLNFHFVRLAYCSWQRKGRVTIAVNDAVLTNLLLLTGQLSATALFATLFFVSE